MVTFPVCLKRLSQHSLFSYEDNSWIVVTVKVEQ